MLVLHQAEWCPFSSAVRELLTELGLPFEARQVEPRPEQRAELQARTGTRSIPVLESDDGSVQRGTRAIFLRLMERPGWEHRAEHRRRFLEHRAARESDAVAQLVERAELRHAGAAPSWSDEDVEVRRDDREHRYELWLRGRPVGLAAYHLSDGQMAITHTEVLPACEGRGLGGRLVAAVLADARRRGLRVLPLCPFVAAYVRRHPEEADVLVGSDS